MSGAADVTPDDDIYALELRNMNPITKFSDDIYIGKIYDAKDTELQALEQLEKTGAFVYKKVSGEALRRFAYEETLYFREPEISQRNLNRITFPQGPEQIEELVRNKDHLPEAMAWRGPVIFIRVSKTERIVIDGNHRTFALLNQEEDLSMALFAVEFNSPGDFYSVFELDVEPVVNEYGQKAWGYSQPQVGD